MVRLPAASWHGDSFRAARWRKGPKPREPSDPGISNRFCGRLEDERIQRILDENSSFTEFLNNGATEAPRKDVEAALRAPPGSTGVTYLITTAPTSG
jgi:hypothetical protein